MSELRSLTPLSEADYDSIEDAVMQTARGRWFMAEYARRNRQADTMQLLGAIGRIERVVGATTTLQMVPEPNLTEAVALIGDLRIDLERISGRVEDRSSGLAARIDVSASAIVSATESVQEAAWSLREAGADDALCDMLDRRATEIAAAIGTIDGTVQRIDKIADTIAMLDSSLRAFADMATALPDDDVAEMIGPARAPAFDLKLREAAPLGSYEVELREIGNNAASFEATFREPTAYAVPAAHITSELVIEEDLVFTECPEMSGLIVASPPQLGLEATLRDIDALSAERKLAYFA